MEIDISVLLTVSTGIMLSDFTALHNAVQWLVGTHEDLASMGVVMMYPKALEALLSQYPELPRSVEGHWEDFIKSSRDRFGNSLVVQRG